MKNGAVTNLGIRLINHHYNSVSEYNQLFDDFTEGVCIIDDSGIIQYINKTYEKIFKVSRQSEVGKSIFCVQHDEIIISALRDRKSLKGTLNFESAIIRASASPMFCKDEFKGVIAIYRHESSKDKISKKDQVVELPLISTKTKPQLNTHFQQIVGTSVVIEKALIIAQKASKTSSTVLIRGESGTGKELVVKAIHNSSERRDKPFIKVNCGAIPSTLLESELFGHEQGAFTGALKRKIGKFEQADGGTIFLDEIGDMPLEMQVKLLRVLQEREIERVGGNENIKCDVRIVAATNRDLEDLISKNKFREDLYYRLNVIPIYLPALRERKEDIIPLIEHFINKYSAKLNKKDIKITEQAKDCLTSYQWPGNIRELENAMERLIALCDEDYLDIIDIPSYISNHYSISYGNTNNNNALINMNNHGELATYEEYEKEIIRCAINKFKSFNAAGKALGITHRTVALKARRYNLIQD